MEKVIIVYSIMHTGTWFSCSMIEKTNKRVLSRSDSWVKEFYKKRIEEMKTNEKCTQKYWQETTRILKQDDWSLDSLDILVLQAHHDKHSRLMNVISKNKPEVPIVIPIRDPMLSLHSKIWRGVEYHDNDAANSNETRKRRCKKWIDAYKRILSLPKENVFLMPIDNEDSKDETKRIQVVKNLCKHCDIEFTEQMKSNAQEWGKVNTTNKLIKKSKKKDPAPRWKDFKSKYEEGNIKHTKAIMGIEFEMLRKDKKLRKMLCDIGYKDLLWWD